MNRFHSSLRICAIALTFVAATSHAQWTPPKHIPPAGIGVSQSEREELLAGVANLGREIETLKRELTNDAVWLSRVPDVEIFHKAVDWALRFNEFFEVREIAFARKMLAQGQERATQLRARQAPWLSQSGLVLRGYRSKLDGSVQPFGLVVPEGFRRAPNRAMVWLLGRGEKRTELAFLQERSSQNPQLVPDNTLIVVPYGRFCNATRFAGEVDVFEALEATRRDYAIDPKRLMVAGFSMGGGSAWHLATHHSGLWCAASPGAGFSETALFTKALEPGKEPRTPWEQKLWAWYDADIVAANLFNCPTVAYAGENDGQKQASDVMEAAMATENLKLERFIGPKTGHSYHEETRKTLTARLNALLDAGREMQPREVQLTTYTLRYPQANWVRIEGMGEHWKRADVRATIEADGTLSAKTQNVSEVSFPGASAKTVTLDGQRLPLRATSNALRFVRSGDKWRLNSTQNPNTLRKRPGQTGPINDAFMESFLFVRPTGKPLNPTVGEWAKSEMAQAVTLWRDVFRGSVLVKDDVQVNASDIASKNLVLWGDASSNAILARMMKRLPLQWNAQTLKFRGQTHDAAHHAPVLIFPNPLSAQRYVVLNSGIDFRSEGFGNNALQTPKLPDWAIVDLRTAPDSRWPGRIAAAGFFDEAWQ